MYCCWISPGHNPTSTQRHSRHVPDIGLRVSCDRSLRGGAARRWESFPAARRHQQNRALLLA